ncbi:hypothetical protein PV11_06243 [Exophiala sideris]|uniref:Uncharacterized protein n=1 Tax=Exophiala sideris TaxID=1016849 RepID=A0A0D1YCQ9_9EURO|nr:hypothetical protein PV11_06243 [Exophiala sideris]
MTSIESPGEGPSPSADMLDPYSAVNLRILNYIKLRNVFEQRLATTTAKVVCFAAQTQYSCPPIVHSKSASFSDHMVSYHDLHEGRVSASADAMLVDNATLDRNPAASRQFLPTPLQELDQTKSLLSMNFPEPVVLEHVAPSNETEDSRDCSSRDAHMLIQVALSYPNSLDNAFCEADRCIDGCGPSSHISGTVPETNLMDEDLFEAEIFVVSDNDMTLYDMWHWTHHDEHDSPDDDDNDNHFGFRRAASYKAAVKCNLRRHAREAQYHDWSRQGHACYAQGTARRGSSRRLPRLHKARKQLMDDSTMALWKAAILRTCNRPPSTRKTGRCLDALEPKPDGRHILMDRCRTNAQLLSV